MESYVLALVASESYLHKAFRTIYMARSKGEWTYDIVLLIPDDLVLTDDLTELCELFTIQLRRVPRIDCPSVLQFWSQFPTHDHTQYIRERKDIFLKYHLFNPWFKQWSRILYLDAGVSVFAPLSRILSVCTEHGVLYAHGDAYPAYKSRLGSQFALPIEHGDVPHFQTTVMILDTNTFKETTVKELCDLTEQYPHTNRGDQGIVNLWTLTTGPPWRQLPVCDTHGFLYDYHERPDRIWSDYVCLKLVRTNHD